MMHELLESCESDSGRDGQPVRGLFEALEPMTTRISGTTLSVSYHCYETAALRFVRSWHNRVFVQSVADASRITLDNQMGAPSRYRSHSHRAFVTLDDSRMDRSGTRWLRSERVAGNGNLRLRA
jgi:hypothetical protein